MKTTPLMMILVSAGLTVQAQIPHAKTETVHIAGNCEMCKSTIETSVSKKNEASAFWDADNRYARITYDSTATNLDEILKRVAYAGYDNARYLAPIEAYRVLEACCQYERAPQASEGVYKTAGLVSTTTSADSVAINPVYHAYVALKDALVVGQPIAVPALAATLAKHLEKLPVPESEKAIAHAIELAEETSIENQRSKFVSLSAAIYAIAKSTPPATTIYYQYCPMYNNGKGAHWLSTEKEIRNPYYGETMLTCGSVVETLGKK